MATQKPLETLVLAPKKMAKVELFIAEENLNFSKAADLSHLSKLAVILFDLLLIFPVGFLISEGVVFCFGSLFEFLHVFISLKWKGAKSTQFPLKINSCLSGYHLLIHFRAFLPIPGVRLGFRIAAGYRWGLFHGSCLFVEALVFCLSIFVLREAGHVFYNFGNNFKGPQNSTE